MPEQFSPIRLVVTLLVLIFYIEVAMMYWLHDILPEGQPLWIHTTVDAGLLTAITSIRDVTDRGASRAANLPPCVFQQPVRPLGPSSRL